MHRVQRRNVRQPRSGNADIWIFVHFGGPRPGKSKRQNGEFSQVSLFSSAEEGVSVTDTVPKRFSACNGLSDSQEVLAGISTEVNVDGKCLRKFVPGCLLLSANSLASWVVCNPKTKVSVHVVKQPKPGFQVGQDAGRTLLGAGSRKMPTNLWHVDSHKCRHGVSAK